MDITRLAHARHNTRSKRDIAQRHFAPRHHVEDLPPAPRVDLLIRASASARRAGVRTARAMPRVVVGLVDDHAHAHHVPHHVARDDGRRRVRGLD